MVPVDVELPDELEPPEEEPPEDDPPEEEPPEDDPPEEDPPEELPEDEAGADAPLDLEGFSEASGGEKPVADAEAPSSVAVTDGTSSVGVGALDPPSVAVSSDAAEVFEDFLSPLVLVDFLSSLSLSLSLSSSFLSLSSSSARTSSVTKNSRATLPEAALAWLAMARSPPSPVRPTTWTLRGMASAAERMTATVTNVGIEKCIVVKIGDKKPCAANEGRT